MKASKQILGSAGFFPAFFLLQHLPLRGVKKKKKTWKKNFYEDDDGRTRAQVSNVRCPAAVLSIK